MGQFVLRLLLDSHTWLWLSVGVELQAETVTLCRQAAQESRLYLSPFSVWELARKAKAGRLGITLSPEAWISETVRSTGVAVADFTFDVALAMSQLPERFHKDPADRALAATCQVLDLTLLTRDGLLLNQALSGTFRALRI